MKPCGSNVPNVTLVQWPELAKQYFYSEYVLLINKQQETSQNIRQTISGAARTRADKVKVNVEGFKNLWDLSKCRFRVSRLISGELPVLSRCCCCSVIHGPCTFWTSTGKPGRTGDTEGEGGTARGPEELGRQTPHAGVGRNVGTRGRGQATEAGWRISLLQITGPNLSRGSVAVSTSWRSLGRNGRVAGSSPRSGTLLSVILWYWGSLLNFSSKNVAFPNWRFLAAYVTQAPGNNQKPSLLKDSIGSCDVMSMS